jgi:hypothetical protein
MTRTVAGQLFETVLKLDDALGRVEVGTGDANVDHLVSTGIGSLRTLRQAVYQLEAKPPMMRCFPPEHVCCECFEQDLLVTVGANFWERRYVFENRKVFDSETGRKIDRCPYCGALIVQ